MIVGLAVFAVFIVIYATLSRRLEQWSITMPMVFVAVGFVLGPAVTGILNVQRDVEEIKILTEITLALLLFADASTLNLRQVREDAALPGRLLVVIVLTMTLGALVMVGLFPGEGLALAALVGAILAPTDAALGLSLFTNPKVPARVRRALNVESGLNDGIATPFVTLFLAITIASQEGGMGGWLMGAIIEIALALVVGVVVGTAGGWLFERARAAGWSSTGPLPFGVMALGLLAYLASIGIGGNGFIAAFIGGITFGSAAGHQLQESTEFTEQFSTFLSIMTWGIFGAVGVDLALQYTTDWRPILYALLSLTLVRMIPVAIGLRGSHLRADTVLMMGWFGPRGLASVVFTLLALETLEEAGASAEALVAVAGWTILLSVILHGVTAKPLATWYSRRLAEAGDPIPELVDVEVIHTPRVQHLAHAVDQSAGTPTSGGSRDENEDES